MRWIPFILVLTFLSCNHEKPMNNFETYTADHIAIRQLIDQYTDVVNHRVEPYSKPVF